LSGAQKRQVIQKRVENLADLRKARDHVEDNPKEWSEEAVSQPMEQSVDRTDLDMFLSSLEYNTSDEFAGPKGISSIGADVDDFRKAYSALKRIGMRLTKSEVEGYLATFEDLMQWAYNNIAVHSIEEEGDEKFVKWSGWTVLRKMYEYAEALLDTIDMQPSPRATKMKALAREIEKSQGKDEMWKTFEAIVHGKPKYQRPAGSPRGGDSSDSDSDSGGDSDAKPARKKTPRVKTRKRPTPKGPKKRKPKASPASSDGFKTADSGGPSKDLDSPLARVREPGSSDGDDMVPLSQRAKKAIERGRVNKEVFTKDQMSRLFTRPQLKIFAKAEGLDDTGTKAQIIARIKGES